MAESEVARFREQLELEIEALKRGMYGLAAGTAKHEFIYRKMERIGELMDGLAEQVGQQEATDLTCGTYMRIFSQSEEETSQPEEQPAQPEAT